MVISPELWLCGLRAFFTKVMCINRNCLPRHEVRLFADSLGFALEYNSLE